ncbi:bile acid:sodium symporter family protein [Ruegeria profundi]|uniref:bile acid:sodium symporter family protein n=1 Tax=Ruegeria profundi TaxID=1685378 RepID=UPI001CD4B4C5|nr:bile acid:sodium symporter [Ruegeria profundi]MCA0928779.1 bile acid:sodium symporter family protein [Ruegeria profundi]
MVGAFEQALLSAMVIPIMIGMGASLTPRDFKLAIHPPKRLAIGIVSQLGFMPLIGFVLSIALGLLEPVAVGLLILSCMPGGTTSNMFTYFSQGNLALSILMTVTSTVLGVVLIPLILWIYASTLELEIPLKNIAISLASLLVPVALGMIIRRSNARARALAETMGSAVGVFFIVFIVITWVPRNWQFLLSTSSTTYTAAILLGVCGILVGLAFAVLLRLHPRDARTIALETGIRNGPLAIAIIALSFSGEEQQATAAVAALYSLFMLLISSLATLIFRRNTFWRTPD